MLQEILHGVLLIGRVKISRYCNTINFSEDYFRQQYPYLGSRPVKAAIDKFLEIRADKSLFKLPGTSEFLDWLAALHHFKSDPYPVTELQQEKTIPYRYLVFKLRQDWQNSNYAPSP